MIRWQLGLKLRVVGIEPQVFVDYVDSASDSFFHWPADFLAPFADLGGNGASIKESIGIIGPEAKASFRVHVPDYQFVVEEEVKLAVASGDEVEGADIVGEALKNFGSYPSCPEGVPSRNAVLDADVQLLNRAVPVVVFLLGHATPPGQCADSSQRACGSQPW